MKPNFKNSQSEKTNSLMAEISARQNQLNQFLRNVVSNPALDKCLASNKAEASKN